MRWYQHGYHTLFSHRLVFAIIPRLPKFLHPPVAAATALIFFFLLGRERRAARRNLARVAPGAAWRLNWKTWRLFYSFCDFVVSYCYVPRASHAGLRAMLSHAGHGAEQIEALLAEGRGLVVWTAHIGNWEFASRLLEMHGRVVNVARVVERDNPAEVMLRDLMVNERLRVVQLNDDLLASVELLAALRNGEIVAMQGDRVYQAFKAELPFCGAPAEFPLGPFLLARISGAPLLPGIVVRTGWLRYRVILGEPIRVDSTGDRDRDLRAALERAVRFLEENVRIYHDQWLNFYDFWRASADEHSD